MKGPIQFLLLALAFLLLMPAPEASAQMSKEMLDLRQTYLAAVEDERAIARGLQSIESIRSQYGVRGAGYGIGISIGVG